MLADDHIRPAFFSLFVVVRWYTMSEGSSLQVVADQLSTQFEEFLRDLTTHDGSIALDKYPTTQSIKMK